MSWRRRSRDVPVLILYEGFGPPPPYHWVHPPANLAAGNQPAPADDIFRRDAQAWTPLKAEVVQATLQIFGTTAQLGVFVAAAKL